MCMESQLVTLLRRLSKEDLNNMIMCLEVGLINSKESHKTDSFQATSMKVKLILAEYEAHEA